MAMASRLLSAAAAPAATAARHRVLILGAGGQLGRKVAEVFGSRSWLTYGADAYSTPGTEHVIRMDGRAGPDAGLFAGIQEQLSGAKLDAIVNVAGGFAMGSAADATVMESTHAMVESSVYSSVAAARIASLALKPGGLLVLPGAAAAVSPTPWSLPYGTAKAAVHHLVRSLADTETAGLPMGVKTIGLAPVTLDTPQNRGAMPDVDPAGWATLDEVSEKLELWCSDPSGVESGMIYVVQKKAATPAVFVKQAPL